MNHKTLRWKRPIMSSASLPCQHRIVPYSIWSCTLCKSLLLTLSKQERWSNTTWACVIWSITEISNTRSVFNRPGLISFSLHYTLPSLKITTLAVQKYLTSWPKGGFSASSSPYLSPCFVFFGVGVGGCCWSTNLKYTSSSCAVITATLHTLFTSTGRNKSAKEQISCLAWYMLSSQWATHMLKVVWETSDEVLSKRKDSICQSWAKQSKN